MNDPIPSWLKSMHNGALGESRAKAFLMDRFWILERSVDIDGADLIIQRRIFNSNLLDKNAPKLGFVQVKFFESGNTTMNIPKAYIIDSSGTLRDEFFLLCFTGFEETSKSYFLTSENINSGFETVLESNVEKFRIRGNKLLENDKFLIQSKTNTLTRIEKQLMLADFKRNREFISWKLPTSSSETSAILTDYEEAIRNSWGDIPKEFQRIKKNALKAMEELEKMYLDLKEIVDEIDPIEAFIKIEELDSELGSQYYGNWGRNVMDGIYDEDFYYTCLEHLRKVNNLREDGLLDSFIKLRELIKMSISSYLINHLPIDSNTVHHFRIELSLTNYEIISAKHSLRRANEYFNVPDELNQFGHIEISTSDYSQIEKINNGIEGHWLPGRIYIAEDSKKDLTNYYNTADFRIYNDCVDAAYDLKYNE